MQELNSQDLFLLIIGYLIMLCCLGAGSLWAGYFRRYFRRPFPFLGAYIVIFVFTLLNRRLFPYGRNLEVLFMDMLLLWWLFIYFVAYFILRIKRWYRSRIG